jgi:hypothetical protein
MKELSIEEKAKAYDERLEKAQKWYDINTNKGYKSIFEDIFPELKESEDERIMRCIGMCLTDANEQRFIDYNISLKDCLDWLEKQGEKDEEILVLKDQIESLHAARKAMKETYKIELKKQGEQNPANKEYTFKAIPRLLEMIQPTDRAKSYCQKLIDSLEQEGYITDAKIVSDCLKQMNGEKVAMATMDEQKPAWSEEDEEIIEKCIEAIRHSCYSHFTKIKVEKFLESLRPHNTWKPSDEQMNTLEYYMHTLVCNEHKEVLFGLYSDLKKLREEEL